MVHGRGVVVRGGAGGGGMMATAARAATALHIFRDPPLLCADLPTADMRMTPSKRAREPYEASVSVATRTPPAYLMATTDPPVTIGAVVREVMVGFGVRGRGAKW